MSILALESGVEEQLQSKPFIHTVVCQFLSQPWFLLEVLIILNIALGANIFMFRKALVNILLLSIPGVILGSLLMAFVLKVILGYQDEDMNWMQAITLGCSLTSTDPVALVALLKEFGSTAKFNTLLEG